MAVSCNNFSNNRTILLYDAKNGTYLNLQLATSGPCVTAVDASGRFLSMGLNIKYKFSIDIYY